MFVLCVQEIRAHFCYQLNCFNLVPKHAAVGSNASGAASQAPISSTPSTAAVAGSTSGSGAGSGAGAGAGVTEEPAVKILKDETNKKFALVNTLYNSIWLVFGCIAAFSSGIFARRFGRCGSPTRVSPRGRAPSSFLFLSCLFPSPKCCSYLFLVYYFLLSSSCLCLFRFLLSCYSSPRCATGRGRGRGLGRRSSRRTSPREASREKNIPFRFSVCFWGSARDAFVRHWQPLPPTV